MSSFVSVDRSSLMHSSTSRDQHVRVCGVRERGDVEGNTDAAIQAETRRLATTWDRDAVISAVVETDMDQVFSRFRDHAEFVELLTQSVAENFEIIRPYVAGNRQLIDDGSTVPAQLARLEADLGIPLSELQRSYRVGVREIWRTWHQHVAGTGKPQHKFGALVLGTERILEALDFIVGRASLGYVEREEELRRSGAQARRRIIEQVLSGEDDRHARDHFPILRYDLTSAHVALLVTGADDRSAELLAETTRGAVGASAALVMRMSPQTVAVWLARPQPWSPHHLGTIADTVRAGGHVASVSEPEAGVAGFRLGWAQVAIVESIRKALPREPSVLCAGDVRLEVLHLKDPDSAKQFIARELGSLGEAGPRHDELRDTLLVFLQSRSHVEAANALSVHEHTVRNRVARAEQILGHSAAKRSTEIQVALRLRRVLDR
jgi:hypothetical protein